MTLFGRADYLLEEISLKLRSKGVYSSQKTPHLEL
jgi:hypothetical protein